MPSRPHVPSAQRSTSQQDQNNKIIIFSKYLKSGKKKVTIITIIFYNLLKLNKIYFYRNNKNICKSFSLILVEKPLLFIKALKNIKIENYKIF